MHGLRLTFGTFMVFLGLAGAADHAAAGTYSVPACRDAAGAPGGWTSFNTAPGSLESGASCAGTGGGEFDGLFGRDQIDPPGPAVSAGSKVGFGFDAPLGTTVSAVSYSRFVSLRLERNWTGGMNVVGGPGAGLYDNCSVTSFTCSTGSAGGVQRTLSGLSATRLEFGGFCVGSGCVTGGTTSDGRPLHYVTAVLYGASVTLQDATPPSVSGLSGPSGWVRGSVAFGLSGSDGQSGLRGLELVDGDGVGRGSVALTCVAAQPVPCPTGSQSGSVSLNTSLLADGARQLRARATDAGGETATSAPLGLRVDNTAPAAPAVSAGATDAWSTRSLDELSVPIGLESGVSPIATVQVQRCEPSGACATSSIAAGAAGSQQRVAIGELADGVTRLRVRLVDEAGNVGAWSEELVERVDRAAPGTVGPGGFPDAWVNASPTLSAVGARDALSGTDHAEFELCPAGGGACVTRSTTLDVENVPAGVGEGQYAVRARQVDRAGNVGAWSDPARLRLDTTSPSAAVGPVPTSVAAGALFDVNVSGEDALSGVASTSLEVQENGVWRSAPGPLPAKAGVSYRFRARTVDQAGNAAVSAESGPVSVSVASTGPTGGATGATGPSSKPGTVAARVATVRVRSLRRAGGRVRVSVSGTTRAVTGSRRVRISVAVPGYRKARVVLVRVRGGRFSIAVSVANDKRARVVRVVASLPGSGTMAIKRSSRIGSS